MTRRARVHVRATIATLVICAARATGQTPDSARVTTPRLIGIFDARTGAPLAGVQVRDAFSGTYAVTTATGTAGLSFLTYRGTAAFVELRQLGYQAKQLLVTQGDTTSITEVMEPFTELAPVITSATYRLDLDAGQCAGFEQRCQSKSVTCIRHEELEKRPAANLADFLIRAAGMTIGSCGGGKDRSQQCGKIAMRSTVIPPSVCQPTFFVDGFQWNAQIGAPTDLAPNTPPHAPYTPTNVKAVEVHPAERARPLRFTGDPLCGAVVIWTK